MKTLKNLLYLVLLLCVFSSCWRERKVVPISTPPQGNADFTRYIAVGNSLTSGYADDGLYLAGQQVSYPSLIATQMQTIGGGNFYQPLFDASSANGSGYLQLTGFNADSTPIISPVTTNLGIRGTINVPGFGSVTLYNKYVGDLNNYGVPGIKLLNITYAPYGNLNGFFERLLPGNAPNNSTTYLQFVTAKKYSFFSNWLGNNDALGYATSGGAGDALTDKATFTQLYQLLINTLTAGGQKGVVGTIPDVTSVPFFNTITVSKILAGVKKIAPTAPGIYINALISTSDTTKYAPRLATTNDLILLNFNTGQIGQTVNTSNGPLPYGLTPYSAIESKYVLDQNEIAITEDYVSSFNQTIKSIAAAKGLAVFDAYSFLQNIKANGYTANGVNVNSTFITGGLFSLDGVHLTPRGYAIVANQFIKAINGQYNSKIPSLDISKYPGVKFP